jgi:hypothetical protein
VPGKGFGIYRQNFGGRITEYLFDIDSTVEAARGIICEDGQQDFAFSNAPCSVGGGSGGQPIISLTSNGLACIQLVGGDYGLYEFKVNPNPPGLPGYVSLSRFSPYVHQSSTSGLPRHIDISSIRGSLEPTGPLKVRLTAADASGSGTAEQYFYYGGESIMDVNLAPRAVISAEARVECGEPAVLDGSLSSDAESDGSIIAYHWFLDMNRPTQRFLGEEPVLLASLPLGKNRVGLVVFDAEGGTDSTEVLVTASDTRPPQLVLSIEPTTLWPPNHRMVPVGVSWQAIDACDAAAAVALVSAASSELDDAPREGDGRTTGDIAGADVGKPDGTILLRAERSASGSGRVYELTYAARDASGNAASSLALVMVPRDLGTGPEPILLRIEPAGGPDIAHVYWNAVPGAMFYDLIAGDVAQIAKQDFYVSLGPVRVLARGQSATSFSEGMPGAVPATGHAFFYLVQYHDIHGASGYGTESAAWPVEPASCDEGCPGEAASQPGTASARRK